MGTRFNFKVVSAGTVISMTAARELSMEEGLRVLKIASHGGAAAIDRVAARITSFTGKPPNVEVLTLKEFRRREEEERRRQEGNDREAA